MSKSDDGIVDGVKENGGPVEVRAADTREGTLREEHGLGGERSGGIGNDKVYSWLTFGETTCGQGNDFHISGVRLNSDGRDSLSHAKSLGKEDLVVCEVDEGEGG